MGVARYQGTVCRASFNIHTRPPSERAFYHPKAPNLYPLNESENLTTTHIIQRPHGRYKGVIQIVHEDLYMSEPWCTCLRIFRIYTSTFMFKVWNISKSDELVDMMLYQVKLSCMFIHYLEIVICKGISYTRTKELIPLWIVDCTLHHQNTKCVKFMV